jgi:hypothetical protein
MGAGDSSDVIGTAQVGIDYQQYLRISGEFKKVELSSK